MMHGPINIKYTQNVQVHFLPHRKHSPCALWTPVSQCCWEGYCPLLWKSYEMCIQHSRM